jgi:hypothetical protein
MGSVLTAEAFKGKCQAGSGGNWRFLILSPRMSPQLQNRGVYAAYGPKDCVGQALTDLFPNRREAA